MTHQTEEVVFLPIGQDFIEVYHHGELVGCITPYSQGWAAMIEKADGSSDCFMDYKGGYSSKGGTAKFNSREEAAAKLVEIRKFNKLFAL